MDRSSLVRTGLLCVCSRPHAIDLTDETISEMKNRGMAVISTITVRESFASRRMQDLSFLNQPLVKDVIPAHFLAESGMRPRRTRSTRRRRRSRPGPARSTRRSGMLKLWNAGVLVAAGTDAPYPGVFQGEGLHRDLELARRSRTDARSGDSGCDRQRGEIRRRRQGGIGGARSKPGGAPTSCSSPAGRTNASATRARLPTSSWRDAGSIALSFESNQATRRTAPAARWPTRRRALECADADPSAGAGGGRDRGRILVLARVDSTAVAGRSPARQRPPISIDTLRADHLRCMATPLRRDADDRCPREARSCAFYPRVDGHPAQHSRHTPRSLTGTFPASAQASATTVAVLLRVRRSDHAGRKCCGRAVFRPAGFVGAFRARRALGDRARLRPVFR